jgi:hypothetical protein
MTIQEHDTRLEQLQVSLNTLYNLGGKLTKSVQFLRHLIRFGVNSTAEHFVKNADADCLARCNIECSPHRLEMDLRATLTVRCSHDEIMQCLAVASRVRV